MKIALALSGLPRIYPISAASWGRILGHYDIDVYIHSWSQSDELDQAAQHQLLWTFNPQAMHFDTPLALDTSLYPDRHWPCIDVYRSLSMWHSIKRANDLIIASGKMYDIIIRGRLDWYVRKLDIVEHNGIVIPYDTDKISLQFTYNDFQIHGYNDHFAYGKPEYMNQYVNTVNLIYDLYTYEAVDYCPENFLAASMVKQQVPVLLQRMEHKLIRG
jgi:hypothetical protein